MASFALPTVALMLAAAVLAGCAADPGASGSDPIPDLPQFAGPLFADGTPAPLNVTYSDCSEQLGVFGIPMSDVDGMLPEGFTPVPFDPAGQMATIIVVAYACMVGNETVSEFNVGLQVEAPEPYAAPDARLHLFATATMTTSPELVSLYQAWGANGTVEQADVSVTTVAGAGPVAQVGEAAVDVEGFQLHMGSAVPMAGGAAETPGFARIFYPDEEWAGVAGAVDFAWTASATGSATGTSVITHNGMTGELMLPETAGLGFHIGGDYHYTASYVALPQA